MAEDETVETEVVENPFEERARRMGWRPKEEYNGPEHRWVDAETFVKKGEEELPILRERMRKLDDRLASTERELTGARTEIKDARTKIIEQSEVLTGLRDMTIQAEKRGYLQAQRELAQRERRAVAEADTASYDQIQREKQALEETRPPEAPPRAERRPPVDPPAAPATTAPPPVPAQDQATVAQWISENPWYNNDAEMQAVAISLHGLIRQQNPSMSLQDNLAEVKNRITVRYPEKFDNQRRRPAAVATSSAPPPKSTKKTVADLPAEAKDALAKFKRQMPNYTDKEYLQMYFGPEEV